MSIKPYEDEQIPVSMESNIIERIPMICDPSTGMIMPSFQKFYDKIVKAVISNDAKELWDISDKSLDDSEFQDMYLSIIGESINKILMKPSNTRKIDIELNIERFKSRCRNILGSFCINVYVIEESYNELLCYNTRRIKTMTSEIFFTYRFGVFQVVSSFIPLITE